MHEESHWENSARLTCVAKLKSQGEMFHFDHSKQNFS